MKGIITQTNHNRCKQLKKPTLTIYRGEQSKTKQIQITFKTQLKNHSKIAVEQH